MAGPLSRIVTALDELRGSSQLALLLHTALRLGNALNAGRKAPQRGIRLGSLRCGGAGLDAGWLHGRSHGHASMSSPFLVQPT